MAFWAGTNNLVQILEDFDGALRRDACSSAGGSGRLADLELGNLLGTEGRLRAVFAI